LSLGKTKFDPDVPAFDVTAFSRPLRKAAMTYSACAGVLLLRKPINGIADCCARATSGEAIVPPRRVIN
jgi:hypothetical protein